MQILEEFNGILQIDAYAGYNPVFNSDRKAGPATTAYCKSHARRYFFELTDQSFKGRLKNKSKKIRDYSNVVEQTVDKIDAILAIKREIYVLSPEEPLAV